MDARPRVAVERPAGDLPEPAHADHHHVPQVPAAAADEPQEQAEAEAAQPEQHRQYQGEGDKLKPARIELDSEHPSGPVGSARR